MISPYPSPGIEPRGGVERGATRLVAALARAGATVTVVAPGPAGRCERDGATAIYVGSHGRLALARRLRPWRRAVRRVLADVEPDVVHGQGLLPGGIAAAEGRSPRVVTAHGNVGADTSAAYAGLGGSARRLLRERLAATATRQADVVVGVHPDWRHNVPVRPSSFVHIPNIVDDVFFSATRHADPATVLFCGGPARIKGWDVLLRAWPHVQDRVPEALLRVAGWPAESAPPALQSGGRIVCDGWLPSALLCEAMEKATLLVLPSRFEVAPLVLLEAWAAGLPVVATAAGGVATLASGAAELVPPDDPSALADVLVAVLEGARRVDEHVAEGRRRAEQCRAASVAEQHLSLYAKLLAA